MEEVVRAVKALQLSDAQGAVVAGWPENKLVKDQIIVPPASILSTIFKTQIPFKALV